LWLLCSLLLLLVSKLLLLYRVLLVVRKPRERAHRERGRISHHHPTGRAHHRPKHALTHRPDWSQPGVHWNTHRQEGKHHLVWLRYPGAHLVNSGGGVHLMDTGGIHLLEMVKEVELLLHKWMDGRSEPRPAEPWRRVPFFLRRRRSCFLHVIKHTPLKVRQTYGSGGWRRFLGTHARGCSGEGRQVEPGAARLAPGSIIWWQLSLCAVTLLLLAGVGR